MLNVRDDMKRMRELQLELNMRRMRARENDYILRDVYLRSSDYFRDECCGGVDLQQGYGTSPVRDCYWKMTPRGVVSYEWNGNVIAKSLSGLPALPATGPTMVFRRYEPLSVPEPTLSLLTRVFLGLNDDMGYKYAEGNKILNDAWVVNLKGNTMTRIPQTQGHMMAINISDELQDLLKVYTDAEAHLGRKENNNLDSLIQYMKAFIDVHEEHKKVIRKLDVLKNKLAAGSDNDEDDGDEDEGDDDE